MICSMGPGGRTGRPIKMTYAYFTTHPGPVSSKSVHMPYHIYKVGANDFLINNITYFLG